MATHTVLSALPHLLSCCKYNHVYNDFLYVFVFYRLQTVDAFEFKPNRVREDVIVRDALCGESFVLAK